MLSVFHPIHVRSGFQPTTQENSYAGFWSSSSAKLPLSSTLPHQLWPPGLSYPPPRPRETVRLFRFLSPLARRCFSAEIQSDVGPTFCFSSLRVYSLACLLFSAWKMLFYMFCPVFQLLPREAKSGLSYSFIARVEVGRLSVHILLY